MQHGPRCPRAVEPSSPGWSALPRCRAGLQALRQMGLEGVLVLDVPPGTPADKAGMQVGRAGLGWAGLGRGTSVALLRRAG